MNTYENLQFKKLQPIASQNDIELHALHTVLHTHTLNTVLNYYIHLPTSLQKQNSINHLTCVTTGGKSLP